MNIRAYQKTEDCYDQLSIKDLLWARDLYHVHLMLHPNVVATAIGRYRIRKKDSWPTAKGQGKRHGTEARTLDNSEVRPYSWPAVLVFVREWTPASHFAADKEYSPDKMIPPTLYLPDGRCVPVCIIKAPRHLTTPGGPHEIQYPLNSIGGGYPVIVKVQGQEHVATIACLVSDGHRVYGLTNRHVVGEPGESIYSRLDGKIERIGASAGKQLTRVPFTDLYPGWAGRDVYVNLDIGLIDIDDLDRWTAKVRNVGITAPMADLSVENFPLSLIGCQVRGYGSGSGSMFGEIQALFYRYKSVGGFEYVADFFIGPRSVAPASKAKKTQVKPPPFSTHPGDSGTLWLLDPAEAGTDGGRSSEEGQEAGPMPLAVQWGEHVLDSSNAKDPQSYALATCLSTVCGRLGVDPIRDWNLDQVDTWGSIGHFCIAASITHALSGRFPKLAKLMTNNLEIIGPPADTIITNDFKNMATSDFVPLSDVPDFFWKHGRQGAARKDEGPSHFADMDQKRPKDGVDLLALAKKEANIAPDIWNNFYDSVLDLLSDEPITLEHRGLLPFRVWQIFDEMVKFAAAGRSRTAQFVCAAGVLAHYVGDACNALHISYLHDGDPERKILRTIHHKKKPAEDVYEPYAKGCHSGFENDMLDAHRKELLADLGKTRKVTVRDKQIQNGFEAAVKTIELMRGTLKLVSPSKIVNTYGGFPKGARGRADLMWKKFGTNTTECLKNGTHLTALLWESAWTLGAGEGNHSTKALSQGAAMEICANDAFLPSCTIDRIGAHLKKPQ